MAQNLAQDLPEGTQPSYSWASTETRDTHSHGLLTFFALCQHPPGWTSAPAPWADKSPVVDAYALVKTGPAALCKGRRTRNHLISFTEQ